MTIIDIVRRFYNSNSSELNSHLEESSFLDINSKYPNCVVIKFGKDKLIGEVSVWQNSNTESYYECEYSDLTKMNSEPFYLYKQITSETVVDELTEQFNSLYKILEHNFR